MIGAMKKKRRYFIFFFIIPALFVYSIFLLFPIVDSMRLSFYEGQGLKPTKFVGLDNYIKLFTEKHFKTRFWGAFFNNIQFFLIVTIVQNILGFVIAVMLTRKFRGASLIRRLSFLPTTLSVLVVGYVFNKIIFHPTWGAFNAMLKGFGIISESNNIAWLGNTDTALPILAMTISWHFLGESILFYTAGIDAIDVHVLEAAKIDGTNFFTDIRYIILPAVWHVVGLVTILIFIGNFTQFDIVYAMTTSRGNPKYSTDLFGSLFYRSAFQIAARDGWGMGMGAALGSVIFFILFIGVMCWMVLFRKKKYEI